LQLTSVRCAGIADFIGGDLLKPDLGRWLDDVEKHKALAVYSPHEGGYEGRYLTRLRYQGYVFLDLSARGLGDPETTLTKIHPVCPVS
jgi:NADH-quinone oxidoreductase cyanobacterial subunit N